MQAVIFDLGRVLIDFDWNLGLRPAAGKDGPALPEIKKRFLEATDLHAFEVGALSGPAYYERVVRFFGSPMDYGAFCSAWNAIFTEPILETMELARALHRSGRVRVAVLSNTNEIHAVFLRARLPLLSELEHVFLSHEIGRRKPDPGAYRHVLDALGVEAARAAFVDDLPENIAAAEALGLRGVVARSPRAVREGLARFGITA